MDSIPRYAFPETSESDHPSDESFEIVVSEVIDISTQLAATLPFVCKHGKAETAWSDCIAPLNDSAEFAAGLQWSKAR